MKIPQNPLAEVIGNVIIILIGAALVNFLLKEVVKIIFDIILFVGDKLL